MDIINSIVSSIEESETVVESIVVATAKLIESLPPLRRLGILSEFDHEGNTAVKKGDIILDTGEKAIYLASGEVTADGKHVAVGMNGVRKTLEPEFVLVGQYAANPMVKKAAGRLATKYPDRRVLTYGALPQPSPIGEAAKESTKGSSVKNDSDPWCTWMAAGEKNPEKGLDKADTTKAKAITKRKVKK